ncbi:MAG: type II toxin-antitoxin system prevent-host-death family antitoxin [Propionibacteriaceae bacterium]|nr:type II toxin-antitoxin system prevent-host-death family antitoxin [Propionibacteriaceae bacterium]
MVTARRTEQKNITLSMTEFKQQLGELSRRVAEDDATVMVESHGKPKLMVISAERGEDLLHLERREQMRSWLAKFRAEVNKVQESNPELDDEAATELAAQILREHRVERDAQKSPSANR